MAKVNQSKSTSKSSYGGRIDAHDIATDLLVTNGLLTQADKKFMLNFTEGQLTATKVVAGRHLENYLVEQFLKSRQYRRLDHTRFTFVNFEEMVCCVLSPGAVLSRMMPGTNGMEHMKEIDLSGLPKIPLSPVLIR